MRMLLLAIVFAPVLALAEEPRGGGQGQGQGPGGHRGPPPEAIQACSNASEGGACSFTAPFGKIEGTCRKVPEGSVACVPAHGPGGPGGREGEGRR